jgi:hypothetical protein
LEEVAGVLDDLLRGVIMVILRGSLVMPAETVWKERLLKKMKVQLSARRSLSWLVQWVNR